MTKGHALEVLGPPRTKKTSQRIVTNRRTGKPIIINSVATIDWTKDAVRQLKKQWQRPPLDGPLFLRAKVYRAARRGDLTNYLEAICDALQNTQRGAGVIENDSQIMALDAVMGYDKLNPRVELLLIPYPGEAA